MDVSRKVKFVIICALGMSSSLVVRSVMDAAKQRGLDCEVTSTPSMTYKDLDYSDVDLILVAPQVRGQISDIQKYVSDKSIPVVPIGMREYGMIKGADILEQGLKVLEPDK